MSGGHFNYDQYKLGRIADEIEYLVETNDCEDLNEWGHTIGRHYPPAIINRLKRAVETLKKGQAMAQRIDWLVSGDDGEDNFLRRWEEEGLDD